MSFEDNEIGQNEYSQNKSKSNGLIIGLIVAVGVAAFFAGMYFSNMNSDQISQEDLDDAIAKLELKLLQNRCSEMYILNDKLKKENNDKNIENSTLKKELQKLTNDKINKMNNDKQNDQQIQMLNNNKLTLKVNNKFFIIGFYIKL